MNSSRRMPLLLAMTMAAMLGAAELEPRRRERPPPPEGEPPPSPPTEPLPELDPLIVQRATTLTERAVGRVDFDSFQTWRQGDTLDLNGSAAVAVAEARRQRRNAKRLRDAERASRGRR